MESIFFSVVIPTFNQAEYLKKALQSVVSQSYDNFEIIVIDNFSSDKTQKIVEEFHNNKIIYKKINNYGVIGKSRNEGIKFSQGNWVAFLDSDDLWYPNRLSVILDFLKKNDYFDVICNDELVIDIVRNRKKIWKYGPFNGDFYRHLLERGNCLCTSATIVKKKFLHEHNILFNEEKSFVTAEDYEFFMNLANSRAKFKFLHQALGERLLHNNSNSANYQLHNAALMSVVKHHVFNVQKFSEHKEKLWNTLKVNLYFKEAIHLFLYQKKYIRSLSSLIKIFLSSPLHISFLVLNKLKKFIF